MDPLQEVFFKGALKTLKTCFKVWAKNILKII